MTTLDALVPLPRMLEIDRADVAAQPGRVWELIRHGELGRSPLINALFALRTLPGRLFGRDTEPAGGLRLDNLVSTPSRPGFRILSEDPPREVAVGAIGKVWKLEIPFVHVADASAYAAFDRPGYIKVAWAIRVIPRGESGTRVEFELRVDATDDESWRRFRRYFAVIGPASRYIRRTLLDSLVRELGLPEAAENQRGLPGDDLLPDAASQITDGVTIRARPEAIWPWLVQMGCRRAGFYSIDLLDNGGVPSARELHPELQALEVGQILPATPDGDDGFEVLRIDGPRALVLGGLFDPDAGRQIPFRAPRPRRFWHVTWSFALEPLDRETTRLHVRARCTFSRDQRLHAAWIRPVHHLMESAQLRNLAARAEGTLPRDEWRDVLEGLGGVGRMALALVTPFRRRSRERWGLPESERGRVYPGDALIDAPMWGWTHAVEIDAPAPEVWQWVAQIGADRAGFYSYQWLENVAGCELHNAETIHPEWQVREGDGLLVHPKMPRLAVVKVEPGSWFLAHGAPDPAARAAGRPWIGATWLFLVEPIGGERCRFTSRYRVECSDDLVTRLEFGPAVVEPVGFVMDRRMLLGVKERAEQFGARRAAGGV